MSAPLQPAIAYATLVGAAIAHERCARGLTGTALARLVGSRRSVASSKSRVSRVEAGIVGVAAEDLAAIAIALSVRPSYLLAVADRAADVAAASGVAVVVDAPSDPAAWLAAGYVAVGRRTVDAYVAAAVAAIRTEDQARHGPG